MKKKYNKLYRNQCMYVMEYEEDGNTPKNFDVGNKTFENQTVAIFPGTIEAPTQISKLIRPYFSERHKPGELFYFDLNWWDMLSQYQKDIVKNRSMMLNAKLFIYRFSHISKSNKRLVHGIVVTTSDHYFVSEFGGTSANAFSIMSNLLKYICWHEEQENGYLKLIVKQIDHTCPFCKQKTLRILNNDKVACVNCLSEIQPNQKDHYHD